MKKNLYITQPGTLSRKDNTLHFENRLINKIIPIIGLENIYLLAEVSVNSKLLSYLTENKILCHFFNYHGYYIGTYYPKETYLSGRVLVSQVKHYLEPESRLRLAKILVEGLIKNLVYILKHYYKHGVLRATQLTRLNSKIKKLIACKSINEVLQVEGSAWEIFYRLFNLILTEEFEFHLRVKRPPDNPINALISFGNSLLYSKVTSKIYLTQLNPTISYLHEPGERRFSLSLDIAEIFKPALTFQTILKLVNKKMLKKEHFHQDLNMCILNEEGRRIFVAEFDKKLGQKFMHPTLKRNFSYEGCIKLELYKLTKHLIGEKEYVPFNQEEGF